MQIEGAWRSSPEGPTGSVECSPGSSLGVEAMLLPEDVVAFVVDAMEGVEPAGQTARSAVSRSMSLAVSTVRQWRWAR